jgi:ABC-type polysaccharide/polyol phosphate transport system ATPase subunit
LNGFELSRVGLEIPILGASGHSLRSVLTRPLVGSFLKRSGGRRLAVEALKDVTLSIPEGTRLGLIGHNGAGKSTLLRVLAGIYEPTSGSITRRGRIMTLFDITQGMLDDASGLENIYARGALLGVSMQEMKGRIDEIIAFSELEDFIHLPLRTYSSGMKLRLAFAVCTGIEVDVALLDEIIGVGDQRFIHKANKRLVDFMDRTGVLVLATHSVELMQALTTRCVVLSHGHLTFDGSTAEAAAHYNVHDGAVASP